MTWLDQLADITHGLLHQDHKIMQEIAEIILKNVHIWVFFLSW